MESRDLNQDSVKECYLLGSSCCRYLELGDELGHEPIVVSAFCEIHMSLSFNIDESGLGLDLRDIFLSSSIRANLVICATEEGHGNLLDV